MTTEERLAKAEALIKEAVESYYVASGMLVIDDQDGYGVLKEMREFLNIQADSMRNVDPRPSIRR